MALSISAEHTVKLAESEKREKYFGLTRELKRKVWNINVTVIPIAISALGTITKRLVPEYLDIKRRVETIQTTALWRSARILKRVLET